MCVLIFSTTFIWNIPHSKKFIEILSEMYIYNHIKYLFVLSEFN
jgi:hypothetical protein